jgi:hypothetical protein
MEQNEILKSQEQAYAPQQPDPKTPKALVILAKVITYLTHPVYVPLAMAYILMKLVPGSFNASTPKEHGMWLISIAVTTLFFPLFSIGLMKPLGFISSFQMPTSKDRIIPLITTMIFYFWINHVFNNIPGIPFIYKTFFLGNFLGLIAVFMFSIFTKVSMHTAGAGSMIGIMGVLLFISPVNMVVPFAITLVVAGIIGSARLVLNAHTKRQIWQGYALGMLAQLAAYWYLR